MKKLLTVLLVVAMLLSSVACFSSCGEKKGVKVIDIALSEEKYAFAVAKDDTDLLNKVNEYLAKITEDGTFDAICDRYFGDGEPVKFESAKEDATKDQLVVATSTGFAPFEMVDENGKYYGIDLEIAKGLAEYLGKELVIKDMKFESVVLSVQTKQCDIGMAGLTITPAREAMVTFSNSYYNASQVLIVNENDTTFDDCKTADDVVKILEGLNKDTKIGCQTGTTGEIYITGDLDNPDGYGFKGLPVTKMAYDYAALAVTAMRNGEINYVILDNAPANAIAKGINK
ncbi:MAG: transporter substrate-binding domain-containing protein [Ruminococcaceae bacterium]|nr:transporter substrate-binding domain-containing protein [Oscillospiraceae bacterium]